jgi:hypothetical protein
MAEASSSSTPDIRLILGGATQDLDSLEHDLEQLDEERLQGLEGARRPSAYVDVFEST